MVVYAMIIYLEKIILAELLTGCLFIRAAVVTDHLFGRH